MTSRGWFFGVLMFWIGAIIGSAIPPKEHVDEIRSISSAMARHGAKRGELILYELADGDKWTVWRVGGDSDWGVIGGSSSCLTIPENEGYHEFIERMTE